MHQLYKIEKKRKGFDMFQNPNKKVQCFQKGDTAGQIKGNNTNN